MCHIEIKTLRLFASANAPAVRNNRVELLHGCAFDGDVPSRRGEEGVPGAVAHDGLELVQPHHEVGQRGLRGNNEITSLIIVQRVLFVLTFVSTVFTFGTRYAPMAQ